MSSTSRPARCSACSRCGCFRATAHCRFAGFRLTARSPRRGGSALFYALGAALLAGRRRCRRLRLGAVAASCCGRRWRWPSSPSAMLGAGAKVFQKTADGSVSLASRCLAAALPARRQDQCLGMDAQAAAACRTLPTASFSAAFRTAPRPPHLARSIDLAAEFERPRGVTCRWTSFRHARSFAARRQRLRSASRGGDRGQRAATAPVLVCCALGFQRSAGAVAAWLVATGRAPTPAQAHARARRIGPAGASSDRRTWTSRHECRIETNRRRASPPG